MLGAWNSHSAWITDVDVASLCDLQASVIDFEPAKANTLSWFELSETVSETFFETVLVFRLLHNIGGKLI